MYVTPTSPAHSCNVCSVVCVSHPPQHSAWLSSVRYYEALIEDEDEDLDVLYDDDDPSEIAWTPEEYWFLPDGGLTGEAYVHLYAIDSKGEFV